MHELAITQGVVDAVTERTGSAPVAIVRVRVGRLAGVVPDAMRFCFELVTAGTPLDGATLEIEQPEGRGRCRTCGEDFVLAGLILLCRCGSADVEVLSGRELAVASVVLDEPTG
jgi:hydrogenase nickel incorporation protein HypA/HybF